MLRIAASKTAAGAEIDHLLARPQDTERNRVPDADKAVGCLIGQVGESGGAIAEPVPAAGRYGSGNGRVG